MFLRSRSIPVAMLGIALAAVIAACSGAGSSSSPASSAHPSGSVARASAPSSGRPGTSGSASASGSVGATSSASALSSAGSPGASASSSECVSGLNLSHDDPALEALLPCKIGGIGLERFSVKLSAYIASSTGGDRELYAPWLVQFGLTPDDVVMAIDADLTQRENFVIHAIRVPGAADDKLGSSFGDVARKAGWPVNARTVAYRSVLEMTDPAAKAAGSLSIGYVFAGNHILYTIITDDPSLLVEGLIKLP